MNAIQITGITAEEFQRLLKDNADNAVKLAVEAISKVKQDPNEEITITEIAKIWGCGKLTVSRRIKDHKIDTVKLGREVAIKRRWLETIKKPKSKQS